MKKCPNCGESYADDAKFCENCGAELDLPDEPLKLSCAVCGAELKDTAKFCGKCGARVIKTQKSVIPERCAVCGAVIERGTAFCANCGSAVNGSAGKAASASTSATAAHAAHAAQPGAKRKSGGSFIGRVSAFEKKHCVFTNAIIAVLAAVVILLSLLCPIKVNKVNVPAVDSESDTPTVVSAQYMEIDQSIYKIIGALPYLNLDMSDADDVAKLDEIIADYSAALKEMANEAQAWSERNKYASEKEVEKKIKELTEKHLKDVNQFAFVLALTTVGALDHISGTVGNEAQIADLLDTARATAVSGLVFAAVVAFMQIVLAAISAVFLVLAIIGIVRKRQYKILPYFTSALAVSGASLIVLALAPAVAVGGAMLAIALTVSLTQVVYSSVIAVAARKNTAAVVKNIVGCGAVIVAFFLLCAPVVNTELVNYAGKTQATQKVIGSLGAAFETLITFAMLLSFNISGGITDTKIEYVYSDASKASAVIVLILGAVAMAALLASVMIGLNRLTKNPEKNCRFDVFAFVGALCSILLAIVPAIIGAADSFPSDSILKLAYACRAEFVMRAYVYVSLAFAVMSVVFGIIFSPKAPTDTVSDVLENNDPVPQPAEAESAM